LIILYDWMEVVYWQAAHRHWSARARAQQKRRSLCKKRARAVKWKKNWKIFTPNIVPLVLHVMYLFLLLLSCCFYFCCLSIFIATLSLSLFICFSLFFFFSKNKNVSRFWVDIILLLLLQILSKTTRRKSAFVVVRSFGSPLHSPQKC
jgi:hypothetical protein